MNINGDLTIPGKTPIQFLIGFFSGVSTGGFREGESNYVFEFPATSIGGPAGKGARLTLSGTDLDIVSFGGEGGSETVEATGTVSAFTLRIEDGEVLDIILPEPVSLQQFINLARSGEGEVNQDNFGPAYRLLLTGTFAPDGGYSIVHFGSPGDDIIEGYTARDFLGGGDGADTLFGGLGNDALFGGLGIDTYTGGPGADGYEGKPEELNGDRILDLEPGDMIFVYDATEAPNVFVDELLQQLQIDSNRDGTPDILLDVGPLAPGATFDVELDTSFGSQAIITYEAGEAEDHLSINGNLSLGATDAFKWIQDYLALLSTTGAGTAISPGADTTGLNLQHPLGIPGIPGTPGGRVTLNGTGLDLTDGGTGGLNGTGMLSGITVHSADGKVLHISLPTPVSLATLMERSISDGAADFRASLFELLPDTPPGRISVFASGTDEWDEVSGLAGADSLVGKAGQDTLIGNAGVDTLVGGPDADRLEGGEGSDVYSGTLADLNGDTIIGVEWGEQIRFEDAAFDSKPIWAADRSHVGLDTNGDGEPDSRVFLEADDWTPDAVGSYFDDGVTSYFVLDFAESTIDRSAIDGNGEINILIGTENNDTIRGFGGNDRLVGEDGDDSIDGGTGADTLNGGNGDDTIIGGPSDDDLRDVVYAGVGNDSVDGGAGNDLIFGQGGNDTIAGGFGVDELQGQDGDDVITGSAFSDLVFGGAGNDFVNGGFGSDRINGGDGADKFFHVGVLGHGSDWVQDYVAADGDVLLWGGGPATADDFQVNFAHTANAEGERSGDDTVIEAFVIYKPTEQILWALVDGGGQSSINLQIGGDVFDLLA